MPDPRTSVVIATCNRRESLLRTLGRLAELPERPPIIVVDNASSDGTTVVVPANYPEARVITLRTNIGVAARNIGVRAADTPYIAFSDDDSWWDPGALSEAADILDAHKCLGLIAARMLIGEDGREDPVCREYAESRLPEEDSYPGRPVLGFVACGAVARRLALLESGGFPLRYMVGGEEHLVAIDLAARRWHLAYVPTVTARHYPSDVRNRSQRTRQLFRNDLWSLWLRRPLATCIRRTGRAMTSLGRAEYRSGFADAVKGLPWVLRKRRAIPPELENRLRLLER
jgi:GT2 family glycosyltransferase